jgi:hypothetical protein
MHNTNITTMNMTTGQVVAAQATGNEPAPDIRKDQNTMKREVLTTWPTVARNTKPDKQKNVNQKLRNKGGDD